MNFDPATAADKLRLTLFLSPPHPCGYLSQVSAATLFVDPMYRMSSTTYQLLLGRGFRRSGSQVYRPYCGECQACVPVRIPVASYKPQKSLRRVWKKNLDLSVEICAATYTDERFALYKSYLEARHHDGPMANPEPDDFVNFLGCTWGKTRFLEFRRQGQLLMVAVVDEQSNSLSAVYSYFAPAESKRSLGSYAILWEIEEARRMGKQWLYLGYWVEACKKMSYKSRFKPMQVYHEQKWMLI